MAVTSQDWLTGFQPMVNPPPVDYLSRYHAGLGYGPGVFASIQRADAALQARRDEQEAAERQARYREQAFGEEPDELPAYLAGPGGMQSDRRKLQSFAAAGDLVGMRDVLARMRKMRERHADALVAWQGVAGDGDFGKTMADAATALSTESFLDDPVLGQPAGGLTVRAVLDNSTPEARARAADRAATEYGVSTEAGDILTNQENPFYHVLDDLRARQAEGALLAKSARTSEAGEAIGRQSKSALTLYSDFLARQSEDGDWDAQDLGAFVKSAGSVFGSAVSSGQLQVMSDMYRRDKERAGRAFSAEAWMRARKAAVDRMVPQITELVPTGGADKEGNLEFKASQRPDDRVNAGKLFDLVLQAQDIATKYHLNYSTETLERAVGEQFKRQYELEQALGKTLSDFGIDGGAAAYAAVSELGGYLPDNDDAGKHLVLKNTYDALSGARHVLGYGADGTPTDYRGFHDLAADIVSGVVEAGLKVRDGGGSPNMVTPIVDALKRHAKQGGWEPNDAFVDKVARRVVANMANNKVESISHILLDERGYFAHADDGSPLTDEAGRPVVQSPEAKVDLTTGKSTKAPPTGKVGLLTTADIPSLRGREADLAAVYREASGLDFDGGDPVAQALGAVLGLQRRKRVGAKPTFKDTEAVREAIGPLMYENAVRSQPGLNLGEATVDFIRSGELLHYISGADKATGVASGDIALNVHAQHAVQELAAKVAEDPVSASPVEVDLLARLLPEVLNRETDGLSKEVKAAVDELFAVIDLYSAWTPPEVSPVRSLVGFMTASGGARRSYVDLSDDDAAKLHESLSRALSVYTGRPVDGKAFASATGLAMPSDVGHGSSGTEDKLEYGGPLALYQKLTWVEPPGSVTTPSESNDKNAETPPVTDKENADAYLASILAKSDQLNLLHSRLATAVQRAVGGGGDKNFISDTVNGAYRDLDQVYEKDGLSAALDYVKSYEHSKLYYMEQNVPIVDGSGAKIGDRVAIRPTLVRGDEQLRALMSTVGAASLADLGVISDLNRQRYPASQELDATAGQLQIRSAYTPPEQ